MITSVFLTTLIIPTKILLTALEGLTAVFDTIVPDEIYNAVTTVVSYLGYFNGVFPIDTLVFCIATLVNFYIAFYIYKIIGYGISIIPFLGKTASLPRAFRK